MYKNKTENILVVIDIRFSYFVPEQKNNQVSFS